MPAVRALVDDACRDVGRDPAEVERSVAVLVRMPGGSGRPAINPEHALLKPLPGDPAELADTLRAYAREGIAHVQLVARSDHRRLDPGARTDHHGARTRG